MTTMKKYGQEKLRVFQNDILKNILCQRREHNVYFLLAILCEIYQIILLEALNEVQT